MEIKLLDTSPLGESRRYQRPADVSPLRGYLQPQTAPRNPRQMFASALHRADISPVSRTHTKLNQTAAAFDNVERLIQEADSLKCEMKSRSQVSRQDARSSNGRLCSTREVRDITNQDLVLKSVNQQPKSQDYKDLYERAIKEHQADRQRWERERSELLRKIEELNGQQKSSENAHEYLFKINREIEELKARVRRNEQQGEKSRTRA